MYINNKRLDRTVSDRAKSPKKECELIMYGRSRARRQQHGSAPYLAIWNPVTFLNGKPHEVPPIDQLPHDGCSSNRCLKPLGVLFVEGAAISKESMVGWSFLGTVETAKGKANQVAVIG